VPAASSRTRKSCPTNASASCGPAGCGMHATFPNQAPSPPTIAFTQAPALFTTAERAGFTQVQRVEMDNPFNSLYELTR
jgi:hypothetical protein